MTASSLLGLALVLLGGGLILVFTLAEKRGAMRFELREVRAVQNLKRAMGLAVEEGKRLHVSIGKAEPLNPAGASAYAGLGVLRQVARLSLLSDRPPVATSGDSTFALLSQNVLRSSRLRRGAGLTGLDRGLLTGVTPFSYVAGALPVVTGEQISAHILTGSFGPEIALMSEAAEAQQAFVLAASDSLPAQAVLFATAEEPLIGEELYALPAYLDGGAMHRAGLRVQDILRWLLALALIAGGVLKLGGI